VALPSASFRDNVERFDTLPFQSMLCLLGEEPNRYCDECVVKRRRVVTILCIETINSRNTKSQMNGKHDGW
jgi:uncharacterized protein (DUF1919 family)